MEDVMRLPLLALAVATLLAGSAAAQCPNGAFTTYGAGCAIQFDVPQFKAEIVPGNCTLNAVFTGLPGCCNTFLTARFLFIGTNQAMIPAPGPGCFLLTTPVLVVFLPPSVTQITAPVPPIPPGGIQAFAQYANEYTTFGVVRDYNLSNGVAMKFSP
jgi:hypothetical protein